MLLNQEPSHGSTYAVPVWGLAHIAKHSVHVASPTTKLPDNLKALKTCESMQVLLPTWPLWS